ncbi:unnamed protein product [Clavelina lepadiformis]|uniref:Uncharacterized protein n=1 Tax=Clavelina lepadiformis TaxID=159417 RepID=A0ABP0FQZ5_CLALP
MLYDVPERFAREATIKLVSYLKSEMATIINILCQRELTKLQLKARSLIKRAYLEAFEVNEFVRKYFRKNLDLTKKAALEQDYLTNYLPFK